MGFGVEIENLHFTIRQEEKRKKEKELAERQRLIEKHRQMQEQPVNKKYLQKELIMSVISEDRDNESHSQKSSFALLKYNSSLTKSAHFGTEEESTDRQIDIEISGDGTPEVEIDNSQKNEDIAGEASEQNQ